MNIDTPPRENLTLSQVAEELGVHYMTAYRYVRLGLLDAHQEGRSWVVTREALEAFRDQAKHPTPRGTADWSDRLTTRLLAGDEPGAWSVIEAAQAAGTDVTEVYLNLIAPSMRDIGERWHRGEIDVAAEHVASRITDRIIGRLGPRASRRGVRRGTVVMGSTATELHALPVAIAADILRLAQFNVLDLGVNLPPKQFARAVERTDSVVAVAVGVTTRGQDDEISQTIEAIRRVTDRPVIVGGSGIDAATAKALGADAYAASAADAVDVLEGLVSLQ